MQDRCRVPYQCWTLKPSACAGRAALASSATRTFQGARRSAPYLHDSAEPDRGTFPPVDRRAGRRNLEDSVGVAPQVYGRCRRRTCRGRKEVRRHPGAAQLLVATFATRLSLGSLAPGWDPIRALLREGSFRWRSRYRRLRAVERSLRGHGAQAANASPPRRALTNVQLVGGNVSGSIPDVAWDASLPAS